MLLHPSLWRAASAALLLIAVASPSTAAEEWETALKLQLDAEKKCQLQAFVSKRQLPVDQLDALEGRIRCSDGREFDFSRAKPHQKFELRLCQPAVC